MKRQRYPSEENIKSMRKKLSHEGGSFILPPDAGVVDRAKYDVCKQILVFMHKKNLPQRSLAKLLGIPETRVSEIVHYKISKFTLDKLLNHYAKLKPNVNLSVA